MPPADTALESKPAGSNWESSGMSGSKWPMTFCFPVPHRHSFIRSSNTLVSKKEKKDCQSGMANTVSLPRYYTEVGIFYFEIPVFSFISTCNACAEKVTPVWPAVGCVFNPFLVPSLGLFNTAVPALYALMTKRQVSPCKMGPL